jgi:hypothetical protein
MESKRDEEVCQVEKECIVVKITTCHWWHAGEKETERVE